MKEKRNTRNKEIEPEKKEEVDDLKIFIQKSTLKNKVLEKLIEKLNTKEKK